MGGDGWAYDIGYGGLDHVLASGKNVNILVLDTQVYSNTGGQQSKATMTGAVAKFAAGGKAGLPKDLAAMAIAYENVYVAKVSMGANDTATVKAFIEAERYNGPSIIIAYSHCVAHGYDLRYGVDQQKRAVDSGLWPIFRFNPDKIKEGENPMTLDYKGPKIEVKDFMYRETRFKMAEKMNAVSAESFLTTAAHTAQSLYARYQNLHHYYEPKRGGGRAMNLSTTFLGFPLKNPLIASASPLTASLDSIKKLEECRIAAVIIHSLFEEEINYEIHQIDHFLQINSHSNAEATSYLPSEVDFDNL